MTNKTAGLAVKGSLSQRHVLNCATPTTSPACVSWIPPYDNSTTSYGLVGEHITEGCPRSIVNMFSQTMITNHTLNVQVLDINFRILNGDTMTKFMQEIRPLVADFQMLPSENETGFTSVVAPFNLPADLAMQPLKPFLRLPQVSGIVDTSIVGQDSKIVQTNVDIDFIAPVLDYGCFDFTSEYCEPLSHPIPFDSERLNLAFRQTMEDDRHVANLGTIETLFGCELETRLRICDTMNVALEAGKAFLFACGVFESSKKVLKCFAHSVRYVLSNLRKQLRMRSLTRFIKVELTQTLASGLVGLLVKFEKCVVEFFTGIKLRIEPFPMLTGRIQPILIHTQFHKKYGVLYPYISYSQFIPRINPWAFLRNVM
jgi:hypothetical protein